jgi:hypothetical protein
MGNRNLSEKGCQRITLLRQVPVSQLSIFVLHEEITGEVRSENSSENFLAAFTCTSASTHILAQMHHTPLMLQQFLSQRAPD